MLIIIAISVFIFLHKKSYLKSFFFLRRVGHTNNLYVMGVLPLDQGNKIVKIHDDDAVYTVLLGTNGNLILSSTTTTTTAETLAKKITIMD